MHEKFHHPLDDGAGKDDAVKGKLSRSWTIHRSFTGSCVCSAGDMVQDAHRMPGEGGV